MQPSSLQLPLTLKVLEFNPLLWDGEVVFFSPCSILSLHGRNYHSKWDLVSLPCLFSTQFNRVMKWLPDSSGHTALRPPHCEDGPVKCRRSGWFPLMKYQYLHLHFQAAALAGFDQTWDYIDQMKEACPCAWRALSTPLLSAPAYFCLCGLYGRNTEIITMSVNSDRSNLPV